MNTVRYQNPFGSFFPTFNKFFDTFESNTLADENASFIPSVDIASTDKLYEVHVAVPGINKEAISIDVKDRVLTISGSRKFENEKEEKDYHRVETSYGSFKRSFELPENVSVEKIEASHENGILTVKIPKEEKAEVVKKIDIV